MCMEQSNSSRQWRAGGASGRVFDPGRYLTIALVKITRPRDSHGPNDREIRSSLHPQIFRRFLAAVRDDIERHLGAIRQAVQAGLLDRRDMDEHVLAAPFRLNENATLRRVEPLHSTATN